LEKKKIPRKSGEISRREFLKDAGLLVGGAAIGSTVLLAACGGEEATKTVTEATTKTVTTTAPGGTVTITKTVEVPGPGVAAENVVKITVNGYQREVQVEPEDTLRDVLRDQLGLTSIKDYCLGYGACGSCTVIMDGRPILSCMTLAIDCDGAIIETAEGIANANHPLIEAYIRNYCMQCGYCTPGFVVTAKALLDRKPNPVEEDIRDALGGNICRCGTYPQHVIAVLEAAEEL
jgi:aerobic-type carbon monoxide dehydrogenase small subunit (CoxS/CutS family)